MKDELIKKVSAITSVPVTIVEKLSKVVNMIHSDDVLVQSKDGDSVISIDMFEGTLYIKIDETDDVLHYKFVPSEEFDLIIKNTVTMHSSELDKALCKSLVNALTNTYKGIV